jgi:flagellar basal body-associated protein FliL
MVNRQVEFQIVGATSTPQTALDQKWLWLALLAVVALMALSGSAVLWLRSKSPQSGGTSGTSQDADKSVMRAWLAVLLVSGLLLAAATSFFIDDSSLRSLLLGGVVSSAGTVVAFYFASAQSQQVQKNLLDAAFRRTSVPVPDLQGLTVDAATRALKAPGLALQLAAGSDNTKNVADSTPPAGQQVDIGGTVTVTTTT